MKWIRKKYERLGRRNNDIITNLEDNPIFSGAAIDTQIENATKEFQLSISFSKHMAIL